jgi:two-component system response regulator YesN
MKIVVIEDEYNTRAGLVRLIGKLGSPYEVVGEAEDGIGGLQVIEETRPDVVITDIKMPHLSGIEMLERMESRGFRYQTIILTGYSEFEYARKALRLGVCEYLEKPIEVEDLQNTLEKVNRELTFQRLTGITNGHPQVRTELILQQAMTREEIDCAELAYHLEPTGYDATQTIECVLLYLGELFEQKGEMLKTELAAIWRQNGWHLTVSLPQSRSLVVLVQPYEPYQQTDFADFLHKSILPLLSDMKRQCPLIWHSVDSLAEMKTCISHMLNLRKWSIVRESDYMMNAETIAEENHPILRYPAHLENKLMMAISETNAADIVLGFNEFLNCVCCGNHHPEQVMDACVRYASSAIRMALQVHGEGAEPVFGSNWMKSIWESQTREELSRFMGAIAERIAAVVPSSPFSLLIQKVLKLIQEKYKDGITLEELAAGLHVTPEYLSTLFSKEVKKTFSVYIKELRINEAKDLLLRTDLKMFAIAEKVGYPDASYFSRVFKDVTGLSPGEYQRLNQ